MIKVKLNKKAMGIVLGTAILISAGTYSSANAAANNTDYQKQIVVANEQGTVEPYRLKALWKGVKAVGSAAKAAYDAGISAADKVGMWLVGGTVEQTDSSTSEEMEVIFDR